MMPLKMSLPESQSPITVFGAIQNSMQLATQRVELSKFGL